MGARIKSLRESRRLEQAALARAVGIGPSHLSSIEAGRASPSLEVAVRLASELNRSLDYLVLGPSAVDYESGKSYARVLAERQLARLSEERLQLATGILELLADSHQ